MLAEEQVMSSPPRRCVVIVALMLLIAISLPRYLHSVRSGAYSNAAQMVVLVWAGFIASARYWAKRDASFGRALVAAAALICIPPLLYHLYDGRNFAHRAGNLILLAGVSAYSYGV